MHRKVHAGVLSPEEQSQKPWQVRHVANEHQLAFVSQEPIPHPLGRIVRKEAALGGHGGERVAGLPERLGRLARAELAAVPDSVRLHASASCLIREEEDGGTATLRERPRSIDFRTDGVAMMN